MKLLPEALGDERLMRMIDPDEPLNAIVSFLAAMRRREGAPLEKILVSEPLFRAAIGDAPPFVSYLHGKIEVGIDPDDPETPLPEDPERPYRP